VDRKTLSLFQEALTGNNNFTGVATLQNSKRDDNFEVKADIILSPLISTAYVKAVMSLVRSRCGKLDVESWKKPW